MRLYWDRPPSSLFDRPCILNPSTYILYWSLSHSWTIHFHPFLTAHAFWNRSPSFCVDRRLPPLFGHPRNFEYRPVSFNMDRPFHPFLTTLALWVPSSFILCGPSTFVFWTVHFMSFRIVHFWGFGPSTYTKLDRTLSPRTVHLHLDSGFIPKIAQKKDFTRVKTSGYDNCPTPY